MKSTFNLEHQNKSIDSRIVAALERISEAFRVLLWNESKQFSLTPIQVQLLIFLNEHTESMRKVSYLAEEFNLTKPTISDAIKTLEEKNLIRRKDDPHDSRSHCIELTSKGKEITDKVSLFTTALEKSVKQLDAEDKEILLLSLIKIIHSLLDLGVITIQRMCLTCAHYRKDEIRQQHFCKLLNKQLKASDLRIDCPEHLLNN